uniref:Uncharacterized protein n=1 Tax=Anguilla anguilla TaxID=7936 RepID=A0A0E9PFG4_ANGAN
MDRVNFLFCWRVGSAIPMTSLQQIVARTKIAMTTIEKRKRRVKNPRYVVPNQRAGSTTLII